MTLPEIDSPFLTFRFAASTSARNFPLKSSICEINLRARSMLKTEVLQSKALWENPHSRNRRNSHSTIFTKTVFPGAVACGGERQQHGQMTVFLLASHVRGRPSSEEPLPQLCPEPAALSISRVSLRSSRSAWDAVHIRTDAGARPQLLSQRPSGQRPGPS